MNAEERRITDGDEIKNGALWSTTQYLIDFINEYGVSFLQPCVSVIYALYLRLTLVNLVVFVLKYVPTGFYVYKVIKNIYVTSRERLRQKQMEYEDIQLQIQIVNTKLSVRDAEFQERTELLRLEAERWKRVRARVREMIAADETLRRALDTSIDVDSDLDMQVRNTPQEDNEFILELLKGLQRDHYTHSERNDGKMDCGEHSESDSKQDQNSLYSSLSDMDVRQDCRIKIFKVTNVYKVAYLKHFIKQKRLRRANKRAALKKKMENIKKLLEDWQKTLTMVINSKLTILNIEAHPIDVASQEAMGDYSKPRESSDSDSDLRNNDVFYDECLIWSQNSNRTYPTYNYEEVQDMSGARDYYEQQDNGDSRFSQQAQYMGPKCSKMLSILEETGSQIAIEDLSREADDADCRDIIAI